MLHSSDVELCARASATDLKACADVAIPPDDLYPRPATQQANESACSTLATDSSSLRFLHDDGASATDLKACADVAIPPDDLYPRPATQQANESACSILATDSTSLGFHDGGGERGRLKDLRGRERLRGRDDPSGRFILPPCDATGERERLLDLGDGFILSSLPPRQRGERDRLEGLRGRGDPSGRSILPPCDAGGEPERLLGLGGKFLSSEPTLPDRDRPK